MPSIGLRLTPVLVTDEMREEGRRYLRESLARAQRIQDEHDRAEYERLRKRFQTT